MCDDCGEYQMKDFVKELLVESNHRIVRGQSADREAGLAERLRGLIDEQVMAHLSTHQHFAHRPRRQKHRSETDA